jgi:hypothetical protein
MRSKSLPGTDTPRQLSSVRRPLRGHRKHRNGRRSGPRSGRLAAASRWFSLVAALSSMRRVAPTELAPPCGAIQQLVSNAPRRTGRDCWFGTIAALWFALDGAAASTRQRSSRRRQRPLAPHGQPITLPLVTASLTAGLQRGSPTALSRAAPRLRHHPCGPPSPVREAAGAQGTLVLQTGRNECARGGSVRLVGADGDKYKPLDSARLLSEVLVSGRGRDEVPGRASWDADPVH